MNENRIREMASDLAFQRGILLEKTDAVQKFAAERALDEFGDPQMQVTALVRGSNRTFYEVEAYFDAEDDELYDVYCTCPAFFTYAGICKHCVALLLHYEACKKRELPDSFFLAGETETGNSRRRTDPGLAQLLQKYGRKEVLALSGNVVQGRVHLEPTIHLDASGHEMSLRIGIEKMYVVKDIFALVKRVRDVEEYSYGKKLSFVHQLEAFDEKSQRLMEFLLRHLEDYDYWYGGVIRRLELSNTAMDECMELLGRDGVLLEFSKHNASVWKLTDEPFFQTLEISGEEDGAKLKLSRDVILQTKEWTYYFREQMIYRKSRKNQQEMEAFEEYMNAWSNGDSFISEEDLPLFVREMLPILERHYKIQTKNVSLEDYQPEEAVLKLYLDLPQKDMITCDLTACYESGEEYHVFAGVPQKGNRDVRREVQAASVVSGYCNAYDDKKHLQVAAKDDGCMYTLLTEGIREFRKFAEVYISERLKQIQHMSAPKVSVGVSLSENVLHLSLEAEGMPLDQLAALLSRYDRKKKFYRLKNGVFVSMEDENLETLAQMKKGLLLTDQQLSSGEVVLPKFRALYIDAQLRENQALPVDKSRDFKSLIRNMKTVEDNDFEVPKFLSKVLREYQKKGYLWLQTLYANGFGGILADDMGLGKTLQVITFLADRYMRDGEAPLRTLIVCPASLVYNWENEIQQFAPKLPVVTVAQAADRRREVLEQLPQRSVVITSYDLLKRDAEIYQTMDFEFQIIDEAQFIKNANTQAAQAVKQISSVFRVALTGTPVENRLSELWSIFDYLMPGYLYEYARFREEIELPAVQNQDADALKRVQKMIAPFILRRLKKDVLKDLPDKMEKHVVAQMEGEQKELYQAHVQRLQMQLSKQSPEEFDKSKLQVLAELTRLRQLCCDPALLYENYEAGSTKLDMCVELVENAIAGGHKLLIFSQFTSMLERIAARLRKKKIAFYMLTGATSKQERARMVAAFQKDEVPVFCISLKAGGTGLNLTAADIVIHYDPWWNTAVQNQATDRVHRIGQKHVVTVYKLIAKDTIEENIVKLQEKKQALADQILSGEEIAKPSFSKEELQELLAGREV